VDTARPQRNRKSQNSWRRDLQKEMWTTGFRYHCRKMEASAQDTELGGMEWSMAYTPLGLKRHKASSGVTGTHTAAMCPIMYMRNTHLYYYIMLLLCYVNNVHGTQTTYRLYESSSNISFKRPCMALPR